MPQTASTDATFSPADWDDEGSATWKTIRDLAETDPTSANNLIALWRSEVEPVRRNIGLGATPRRVLFSGLTIEQVRDDQWEKWVIVEHCGVPHGFNSLEAARRSIAEFSR